MTDYPPSRPLGQLALEPVKPELDCGCDEKCFLCLCEERRREQEKSR
jgi:hypothetical protein